MLVGFAKELKFEAFCTALDLWAQRADPEGAEEAEFERRDRRDVYLAETINGMYLGAMTLDPVSGAIVAERARAPRRTSSSRRTGPRPRSGSGESPRCHELARTWAQRRADALVEMATRRPPCPPRPGVPSPTSPSWSTTRPSTGHICRIQGGPVVSPGTILEHLDGATFERIVFAPGNGRSARSDPASSPGRPEGPSRSGTKSAPMSTATCRPRSARSTTSCPTPRGPDHPGQRPGPLRLPQPAAQPHGPPSPATTGPSGGAGKTGRLSPRDGPPSPGRRRLSRGPRARAGARAGQSA